MKFLTLGLALFLTVGCSTETTKSDDRGAAEYEKVLGKYCAGDTEYNGFYHSFGYHAAMLNSEVLEANLQRQSKMYLWDQVRTEQERDKVFKAAAEGTDVFVSFYTPERKDDNLSTDKSIWRALLDVNGKRYVGKVKKLKNNLSEMITLYPFHTRWNTAYMINFPIPVSQSEMQSSKLTITGPLGARSVDFQAKDDGRPK